VPIPKLTPGVALYFLELLLEYRDSYCKQISQAGNLMINRWLLLSESIGDDNELSKQYHEEV
jgi:hypothetical protein